MKHSTYYSAIKMFISLTKTTKGIAFFILLLGSPQLCLAAASQTLNESKLNQGKLLMAQGHYEQAYEQFFEIFNKTPGDIELDFLLGKAAYAAKDYESAIMAFERVIMVDSDSTATRIELAKSFFLLGSHTQAQEIFTHVLDEELPEASRVAIEDFLQKTK